MSTDHLPHLFAGPPTSYGSRRDFLRRAGMGFGGLALAGLLDRQGLLASEEDRLLHPLAPRPGHFPGTAQAVIWLFINGGPSHVDTWDYKPELARRDGQELPGFDRTTGFFIDQ